MKKCSKCGVDKDESEFSKDKTRADGMYPVCKQCCKIYQKSYYANNKEKMLRNVKNIEKITKKQ